MFGIGANELVIILLFGFLIFGPDKLPAMAKTIGAAIAKFRTAQQEMSNVIRTEVYDPTSDDPFKNPLDALSKIESKVQAEDRQESFAQRKARYDRQRAAKKAAEQKRAEQAAKGDASTGEDNPVADAAPAADGAPQITAEQLYGTAPRARTPEPASSRPDAASAPSASGPAEPVDKVVRSADEDAKADAGTQPAGGD